MKAGALFLSTLSTLSSRGTLTTFPFLKPHCPLIDHPTSVWSYYSKIILFIWLSILWICMVLETNDNGLFIFVIWENRREPIRDTHINIYSMNKETISKALGKMIVNFNATYLGSVGTQTRSLWSRFLARVITCLLHGESSKIQIGQWTNSI